MNEALPSDVLTGARAVATLVRTPRAFAVLARLLAAGGAALLVALVLVPWQQNVTGTGRVVALAPVERQQVVTAPLEGRVTRWLVREGSVVRKGELLLELTDNDPDILRRLEQERDALDDRKAAAVARAQSLRARQRALLTSKDAAIRAAVQRVGMAKDRTRAAQQALEVAKAARETARKNRERQAALHEQGLTSRRALELAELDEVKAATDVERAAATLQAASGEESALDGDRQKVESDVAAAVEDARASEATAMAEEASTAAELARLDVRLARQSTMEVRAPLDGTVLRIATTQGTAFVKAGEPLLVLVPDTTERAVEIWLDGNDVPLVAVGREVRLQFEGWPAVQFSGWPSVAVGTFGGRVVLVDASDDGQGRFRILVQPERQEDWPSAPYLRQGVRVNGWVLLDQVRLGYELWRRFNGFPPALKSPGAPPAQKEKAS
ncbi:MAG: HlyD family secretion protein [Myxococcaceae bacterium]|nr:HlyD family secretion protein [Myxococcaceae bacterium]